MAVTCVPWCHDLYARCASHCTFDTQLLGYMHVWTKLKTDLPHSIAEARTNRDQGDAKLPIYGRECCFLWIWISSTLDSLQVEIWCSIQQEPRLWKTACGLQVFQGLSHSTVSEDNCLRCVGDMRLCLAAAEDREQVELPAVLHLFWAKYPKYSDNQKQCFQPDVSCWFRACACEWMAGVVSWAPYS